VEVKMQNSFSSGRQSLHTASSVWNLPD